MFKRELTTLVIMAVQMADAIIQKLKQILLLYLKNGESQTEKLLLLNITLEKKAHRLKSILKAVNN